MAITQRGTATSATSTGGSNVSPAKPTGTVSGDVLVAFGCTTETTPYFDTVPSGWTQFESSATADTPNLFQGTAWYKVAGGSEPSTYTWGSSGASGAGAPIVVTISAWTGVDNTTPIDDSSETAGSAAAEAANPATSITQTTSGRVLFARMARAGTTTATFTNATGGWSELVDVGAFSGGSVSYAIGVYAQDNDSTGAQTEPAITCAVSETDNVYILLALKASGNSGTLGATLPAATSAIAGEIISGPIAATLPAVTSDINVFHGTMSGTVDTTLPAVTSTFAGDSTGGSFAVALPSAVADFAGQIINGSFSVALPAATADVAGSVNPIGSISVSLPALVASIASETIPFGEHVIHVEPEKRAFLVIDDDPGLTAIYNYEANTA